MLHVTLRTPEDVARTIPRILGFHPSDSLVIAGTGGGPVARVDIGPTEELARGLAPALTHWAGHSLIAVVYAADRSEAARLATDMDTILPDMDIAVLLGVDSNVTYDPTTGDTTGVVDADEATGTSLDERTVHSARDELATEAERIVSADTCEEIAATAYRAGDGARAWVFHDRAVALRGEPSMAMRNLAHRLTNAVNPRGNV